MQAEVKALPFEVGETCVLRQSRLNDAIAIMADIREEDLQEWDASVEGGMYWLENSILQSLENGECITLSDKASDIPMVIFGVIRREGQPSDIWMVATHFGVTRWLVCWHYCIEWINAFWQRWPSLHCWSDVRNPEHHRFLEWCGFSKLHTGPWGWKGLDFHYYRRG